MSWTILFLAGLAEVGWAVGLKLVDGLGRPWLLAATIATMVLSLYLLGVAMKNIPLGTAYAIWTGIGVLGTFIAGVVWFGETVSALKLISVTLVIAGLIGLKL